MNPRCPTVVLTRDEGSKLREMMRDRGAAESLRMLGIVHVQTLYRAAAEQPIARLTAEVIRGRLDRI